MAEILYQMFGSASNALVEIYLANQVVLNTLVVVYGSILALVLQNLKKIETRLLKESDSKDWTKILTRLAALDTQEFDPWVHETAKFKFIASSYFFGIYRLNKKNLIRVLGKKHGVSRTLLTQFEDPKGESS